MCAQSTILNAELKNVLGSGVVGKINESNMPDSLSEWSFVNCSTTEISGTTYVSVAADGSVTTRSLGNDGGNMLVAVMIRPLTAESLTVFVSALKDETTFSVPMGFPANNNNKWLRREPALLKDIPSGARLRFSGSEAFVIVNVIVRDLGDGVFYESFSKCPGNGGNNDFSGGGIELRSTYLDYPYDVTTWSYTQAGANCLYMGDGGIYKMNFPSSETGDYLLSFRAAGVDSNDPLKVEYYIGEKKDGKKEITDIPKGSWKNYKMILSDVNSAKNISFIGKCHYLDDVLLTEIKNLEIDEQEDNSSLLTAKEGKTVYAHLVRTFKADIWNTCCLPFAISAEQLKAAAGDDELEVELRRLLNITDGVFNFKTATEIPAGEPFLLKVGKEVENPVFADVEITAPTPQCMTNEGYGFQGIYGRTDLLTDRTNMFLGTDGKLHTPTSNNTMNGMRAYMIVPSDAPAHVAFIDTENDETVTPVAGAISHRGLPSCYYTLQGQRVESPKKGIYLYNGKKVIID
jgi:hypothetical protein